MQTSQSQNHLTAPRHDLLNLAPVPWPKAHALAEQACLSVSATGGTARTVLDIYGLNETAIKADDWHEAAQRIALLICSPAHQRPC